MPDLPISLLPYVGNTGYTENDLLVFVNYTIPSGTTSNTTLQQHKEWILSGMTGYYLPLSGGTLTGGITARTINVGTSYSILWTDESNTFPTSPNNKIRWDLNNDSAEIYAQQITGDTLDLVFKIADNPTGSGADEFVYWVDSFQGEGFDAYPLTMNGSEFIVNSLRRYSTSATTSGSGNVDFYILKTSATSISDYLMFADTSESNVKINGNLGVNITGVPTQVLDINGTIRSRYDNSETTILIAGGETAISGTPTNGDGIRIKYEENLFNINQDGLVFEKTDANQDIPDGGIMFANTGSGGTRVSAMVIRGNGNVGIGVNTPNANLHVNNTGTTNSFLVEDSANPDSSPFVINANGNVGIGTTSPTQVLDINGTIRSRNSISGTTILIAGNETAISGTPTGDGIRIIYEENLFGEAVDGLVFEKTDFNQDVPDGGIMFANIGSGGTRVSGMVIRGDGNVGIGITTPTNLLHISASTNPVRFEGLQSGNTDTRILTSDSNGVIKYRNFSDFSGGTSTTGDYLPLSGGTVSGDTIFQSGLTATTISGGTFYGDGTNLLGIPKYYKEPTALPTVSPVVTGVNSIALGDGAEANSDDMLVYGKDAGSGSTNNIKTIIIGYEAGKNMSFGERSIILGQYASSGSNNSNGSILIGSEAGRASTSLQDSISIGRISASGAQNVSDLIAIGGSSGNGISESEDVIAIGLVAGNLVTGDTKTMYLGSGAGSLNSSDNTSSNFIGQDVVGNNNSYSNFIGYRTAGYSGTNNTVIGTNIKLPDGTSNRINIGGLIFGINSNFDIFNTPSEIPTVQGKIGIGIVTPLNRLHVEDTSNPLRLVGLQSGNTDIRILTSDSNGVIRYRNLSDITGATTGLLANYLPLSGGTLTGGTVFTSGLTANTISATTISGGTFYGDGTNLLGIPKYYKEPTALPTISPLVIGTDSIAIGNGAKTSGDNQLSFGTEAGQLSISGEGSNFIGWGAGYDSTGVTFSNLFGYFVGERVKNVEASNIIGEGAGIDGNNIYSSNLYGTAAGTNATNIFYSNLIGYGAGLDSNNIYYTNFIGSSAGENSSSSLSNFIGHKVGQNFSGGNNNIIIGTNISLPNNVSNSINIGGVLFGVDTYSTSGGTPSIIPTTNGKIGIGVVTPLNRLHVEDTSNPLRLVGLQSGNTDTRILSTDSTGVIRYRNLDSITCINTYTTTGITVSSQTLTTSFNYYGVSFSGNVDLILPNPAGYDGKTIVVKDESGLAGIYRIRLSGSTGLIDNTNYVDMNTNYISLTLMARNNNWWII